MYRDRVLRVSCNRCMRSLAAVSVTAPQRQWGLICGLSDGQTDVLTDGKGGGVAGRNTWASQGSRSLTSCPRSWPSERTAPCSRRAAASPFRPSVGPAPCGCVFFSHTWLDACSGVDKLCMTYRRSPLRGHSPRYHFACAELGLQGDYRPRGLIPAWCVWGCWLIPRSASFCYLTEAFQLGQQRK